MTFEGGTYDDQKYYRLSALPLSIQYLEIGEFQLTE